MLNPAVREKLLNKLRISPQALSQRAKQIKKKFGPMTTEEAVYVIAHVEDIDFSKDLPLQLLDRIRSLVPREIASTTTKISQTNRKRKVVKKVEKTERIQSYPLVVKSDIQHAMSVGRESFPQMFIIENSMRKLIKNILSTISADWWISLVPPDVQKDVRRVIEKEKKYYPYRESRGNEPLLYCNFIDLMKIVLENKNQFKEVMFDFSWFETKMKEIYMARNNLAHNIPLSEDDISRIALFYRDWGRLLESAGMN